MEHPTNMFQGVLIELCNTPTSEHNLETDWIKTKAIFPITFDNNLKNQQQLI